MKKLNSILLIDDDPICSWLNKALLEDLQAAASIECMSDGQSALDYLYELCVEQAPNQSKEPLPDLILLDLNMPGLDGFEFLEKLQTMNYGKQFIERIVILTTSLHQRDVERAGQFKVTDYLVKPLNEVKIREMLDNFLINHSVGTINCNTNSSIPHASDRAPSGRISNTAATEEHKKKASH